jgi:transcriptional regulator with XRE-family HTH domain
MSQSAEDALGKTLAKRVKTRRDELELSQEKLAARAGMTRELIRQIEGGHIPKLPRLYNLARALEVNLWDLLPSDSRGGSGPRGEWVARDSNPEPTDSRTAGPPRLRVAAASKTRKQATERVKRKPSRGRHKVPIATARKRAS